MREKEPETTPWHFTAAATTTAGGDGGSIAAGGRGGVTATGSNREIKILQWISRKRLFLRSFFSPGAFLVMGFSRFGRRGIHVHVDGKREYRAKKV